MTDFVSGRIHVISKVDRYLSRQASAEPGSHRVRWEWDGSVLNFV